MTIVGLSALDGPDGHAMRVDRRQCCANDTDCACPHRPATAREPWRLAAAALHLLGQSDSLMQRFGPKALMIRQMLEKGVNTPETSSAGRWFDAAAALLGVREINAYEGQAAMELEALAHRQGITAPLANGFRLSDDGVLDLLPLLAWLAEGVEPEVGAACFHATLAIALSEWLRWAGEKSGIQQVALGGGCFLNRLLTAQLQGLLEAAGWRILTAKRTPPNDGGLSLGQAWVAIQASVVQG